jgi:hypothetical protein
MPKGRGFTARLVKRYDVICVEDLQMKNMVKNRRLAKSINDAAWGVVKMKTTRTRRMRAAGAGAPR